MFEEARLKLERAKHHISDLNSKVTTFFSSGNYQLRVEDDRETRQRALCFEVGEPIPREFSLIIGDAVHNLRTALDMMTWEVLSPYNPPKGQVQFPVGDDATGFKTAIDRRHIKLAGPNILQAFHDLKVYPGGNDDLFDLHWLDVSDKHKLILVVAAMLSIVRLSLREIDAYAPDVRVEGSAFINMKRVAVWPLVPGGQSLGRVNRRLKQSPNLKLSFTIAFGRAPRGAAEHAIPALKRLTTAVGETIGKIEVAAR